jgi:hypothetical protein
MSAVFWVRVIISRNEQEQATQLNTDERTMFWQTSNLHDMLETSTSGGNYRDLPGLGRHCDAPFCCWRLCSTDVAAMSATRLLSWTTISLNSHRGRQASRQQSTTNLFGCPGEGQRQPSVQLSAGDKSNPGSWGSAIKTPRNNVDEYRSTRLQTLC